MDEKIQIQCIGLQIDGMISTDDGHSKVSQGSIGCIIYAISLINWIQFLCKWDFPLNYCQTVNLKQDVSFVIFSNGLFILFQRNLSYRTTLTLHQIILHHFLVYLRNITRYADIFQRLLFRNFCSSIIRRLSLTNEARICYPIRPITKSLDRGSIFKETLRSRSWTFSPSSSTRNFVFDVCDDSLLFVTRVFLLLFKLSDGSILGISRERF